MLSLAPTDPTQLKLKNLKVKLESVVYESQFASTSPKTPLPIIKHFKFGPLQ